MMGDYKMTNEHEQFGFIVEGDIFNDSYEEPEDLFAVQAKNLPTDFSITQVVEHYLKSNPEKVVFDLKCFSRIFGALEVKVDKYFGNDQFYQGYWSIRIRKSEQCELLQDFCSARKVQPSQLLQTLSNNGQTYIDFGKTRVYFVN